MTLPTPGRPFAASAAPPNPGPPEAWLPRPYAQLMRGPTFRWWRPLLSVAVMAGWIVAVFIGSGIVLGVYLVATGREGLSGLTDADINAWAMTPSGLAATNLLLACLLIGAQLSIWAAFGWRPRWVASVVGRIRWGWLARCYAVSAGVVLAVTVAITVATGGMKIAPEKDAVTIAIVVLLTTPLQAAGEEYVFRGWLPQTLGAWFRRPVVSAVVAGLVSSTLFALAHGQQDPWLFADRFGFALFASWMVWRTGGLEASIALHGVNNLVAFGFSLLSGQLGDMLTQTSGDPLSAAIDVAMVAAVAVVVDRMARRGGIVRMFRPPVRAW